MGQMHRRTLLVTIAAVVVTAPPAGAATPVPDAEYAGTTGQGENIRLLTAATGPRVELIRFTWRIRNCENARKGVQGTLRMGPAAVREDGRFNDRVTRRQRLRANDAFTGGTQTVRARLRGRFVRSDFVRGVIRLAVVVRNRAGVVIDRCETTRAVRWSAKLLGTEPETTESSLR